MGQLKPTSEFCRRVTPRMRELISTIGRGCKAETPAGNRGFRPLECRFSFRRAGAACPSPFRFASVVVRAASRLGHFGTTYSSRSVVMPAIGLACAAGFNSGWDSLGSGASTALGRGGTATYSSRSVVMSAIVPGWDSSWPDTSIVPSRNGTEMCSSRSAAMPEPGTATYSSRSVVMPGPGTATHAPRSTAMPELGTPPLPGRGAIRATIRAIPSRARRASARRLGGLLGFPCVWSFSQYKA